MLVLSRKINQSIIIGDDIEIMLVDIRGDQIKLGINAPKNVKIFRKEVYEDIENTPLYDFLSKGGTDFVLNKEKLPIIVLRKEKDKGLSQTSLINFLLKCVEIANK